MSEIPIKIKKPLSFRQEQIFKILVESYIEGGLPVSSSQIKDKGNLEISPATIRIELANLENQGLVQHLYSSSGCVPTDEGYRFFIDYLMEEEEFEKKKEFIDELNSIIQNHNELIKKAVELLARESDQISWGSLPSGDIYATGLKNFLKNYPEFLDERILRVIEVTEKLKQYLSFWSSVEECEVFIGKENPIKGLDDFSLMIAPYKFDHWGTEGFMGIIGSKRVAYYRLKPLLIFISNFLNNYVF